MKRFSSSLDPLDPVTIEENIARYNPLLNGVACFETPDPTKILHVLVKDNISLDGYFTSAGSAILQDLKLPESEVVARLKDVGIDVFGKTTMTELAGMLFDSTLATHDGYSYLYGYGVNPRDANKRCGSSSSGCAISVAARFCDGAIGTETRCSVISPAKRCNVWAYKCPFGAVPTDGIIPVSRHFDTIGVFGKNFDTLKYLSEIVEARKIENKRPTKVGILNFTNKLVKEATIESTRRILSSAGLESVVVNLDNEDVHAEYSRIVRNDFVDEMDELLHSSSCRVKSFRELVQEYASHPEIRPEGMERLLNTMSKYEKGLDTDSLADILRNKQQRKIGDIINQYGLDCFVSVRLTDLWSITGYPSIVIPAYKNRKITLIASALDSEIVFGIADAIRRA